jgi:hypothetical protein
METDRRRSVYHCQVCGALAGELHADGCEENFPPARSAIGAGPVFAADQCPECHCAPDAPHNQDCPDVSAADGQVHVPLPLQERLLEQFLNDEWPVVIAEFIARNRDEIVDLAFSRLRGGYGTYRSRMYDWDAKRRTDEAMEEVADLVNYLSSGEVE